MKVDFIKSMEASKDHRTKTTTIMKDENRILKELDLKPHQRTQKIWDYHLFPAHKDYHNNVPKCKMKTHQQND